MAREKKDAKLLNIKMNRDIHEHLEQFCEESGMTKTMAVEKILENFFREYFDRPESERRIFR